MSITKVALRPQCGYQDILVPPVEQAATLSLLESGQSGQCDTKALEIFARRELEHDRIAAALRHHAGLADPLIPKALETHHRAIPEAQQIQHPRLQVPSQCRDHEVGLIRRHRAGRYMGQSQPVLEVEHFFGAGVVEGFKNIVGDEWYRVYS